ncbi:dihydrolipoyllysine-residue succinyltransferase [Aureococcus anophagefferens]|nr:dihydrolipoyllysine-residue succinyltransferase [Aureococcus anophagefferens]
MLTLLPLLASSFAPPPRVRVVRVAPRRASDLLLIGDVGGTNSRLQLHEMARSEVAECAFDGTGCAAAAASGKLFFRDEALADAHLAVVCLAVAGVVKNNACQLTNRDALWRIDGAALDAALPKGAAKVVLVNDFLGAGYGLLSLDPRDSVDLAPGDADGDGPMACLGAGTGLGEVYLTPNLGAEGLGYGVADGGRPRRPRAARRRGGGSARLAQGARHGRRPRERRARLLGPGVAHAYAPRRRAADPGVAAEVAEADAVGQGARVIGAAAAEGRCDVCARAMDIFASLLGNEAGDARRNAALKWNPTSGLFLAGGVCVDENNRRLFRDDGPFMAAYRDRGRVSPFLDDIPVRLVTEKDLGLRGAKLLATSILASANRKAPS